VARAAFARRAAFAPSDDENEDDEGPPVGGFDLVWAPSLLSRTGVRYIRCRSWRQATKKDDMAAFKRAKIELPDDFITIVADELVRVVNEVCGKGMFATVAPVACGHSRRPDCLSARLAVAAAEGLGSTFRRIFDNRFVSGVSHPKEFDKLPPLTMLEKPAGPVLMIDDAATSGWHMHEAVTALRTVGVPAMGAVWMSGVKR
jgi:hypothetical protein